MKKRFVKPFDLEEARKGALVETKSGRKARIVCYDRKSRAEFPLLVLIETYDGKTEESYTYPNSGKFNDLDKAYDYDLVLVEYLEEDVKWSEKNEKVTKYFYDVLGNLATNSQCRFSEANCPATPQLAKKQYAEAKISHILLNDAKYGGMVKNEEWGNHDVKYTIERLGVNTIYRNISCSVPQFLAFHRPDCRDLFIEDYPELVNDYLMID